MANEFKIKKGLIVEGASGGTVVDVQGSQGQLFSVTDNLSGSIFAVSDISGVPILDVNSSGISYFDGSVGIGIDNPNSKLHVLDGVAGTYTPYNESDTLVIESDTPGGISLIGTGAGSNSKQSIVFGTTSDVTSASIIYDSNNSVLTIGTTTASNYLKFVSGNGTLALTLDTSQNAIFAGSLFPNVNGGGSLGIGSKQWSALNLTSGAAVLWANGDASIVEGEVGNYSLSFKTYDGTSNSRALLLEGNNDATFSAQAFSSATSSGDASSTLTTKGYVDGLITGATIYRGTWQAGISATSSGATTASTTLTVSAAILDAAGNTPVLVGAVVTGAGITGTVKVATVTSSTVYELDTAISATATAYIFSPIYGAPDLSGVTQTSGYYYICSEAGSATPNGAGTEPNTWGVGDWVIWNDDVGSGEWQKVDNSSVLSGAGTGQTVALWEGPSSVTDSDTLGNAPITFNGNNATFAGNVTAADLLTVNGDGHLFLGADGETPKIDMMYDDHASGAGWDTRIFTGKTDDLPNAQSFPTSTIAGGFGTQYQANSDGAFFGIIPYATGNYRPVINWGDDAADSPFSFQFNGTNVVNIDVSGNVGGNSFTGDHIGTINTATTGATQTAGDNSTKIATTAYADAAAAAVDPSGVYLPLAGGTLTGGLIGTTVKYNTQLSTKDLMGQKAFIGISSGAGAQKFKIYKNTNTTDGYARFKIDRAYDYGNSDQMVQEAIFQRRNTSKNFVFRYDGDIATGDDVYLEVYELSNGLVEIWLCADDYAQSVVQVISNPSTSEIFTDPSAGTPTGTLIYSSNPDTETPNWNSHQGVVTATTFSGDLNGTINTATTGVTQTAGTNSTLIATTAYADAAASAVPIGNYLPLSAGSGERVTGDLYISDKLYMRPSATYGNGYKVMHVTGTGNAPYPTIINFSNYAKPSVMVINDENVGIGTDAPPQRLSLFAGTNESVYDVLGVYNSVTGTTAQNKGAAIRIGKDVDGNYSTKIATIYEGNNPSFLQPALAFYTMHNTYLKDSETEKMRISSNGNVGIGFTSPGSTPLSSMKLSVSGNTYVSGNVGIGTTSPAAKLQIASTGTNPYSATLDSSSNMKGIRNVLTSNTDDMVGVYFATGTTTNGAHWSGITGSRSDNASHWGTQLNFYTHNNDLANLNHATQKMVIKGDGNVGIGTTSPSEKLEVSGKVRIFDGGYPYIDLGVSTSNYFRIIHDNPNDILKIGKNGATTSSSLIVQGGTGNVGIGGVPGSRFDIKGTQGQLFSVTDDLSGDIFSVADISGVPIMNVNSDGTSYFDGNVGIGATGPAGKLTIADTAFTTAYNSIKGLFFDNSNVSSGDENFGTGIEFGKLGSGGNLYKKAAIVPVQSGADSDQMGISFFVANSATQASPIIEAMRVDYGGKVGIGTISPGSTLTLGNATSNVAELRVLRSNSLSTTYGFINTTGGTAQLGGSGDTRIIASTGRLLFNSNNTDQISLESNGEYRLKLGSTTTGYEASMSNNNTAYQIFGSRFGGTGKYVAIWSDGANENTRFYPTNTLFYKNVGIGGNSPSYLFDVRKGSVSGAIARFSAINPHVIIESSTAGNAVLHFKPNATGAKNGQFKVTAGNGYGFSWSNDASGTAETAYMDLDTSTTGGGDLTVKGDVIAYGSPSDKKYKENIKPIESALDKAMQLQGVTFDWKDSESILEIKEDIGFIAQDVQEVLPELVRDNGKGNLSLRYQGITPILLEAIKELKAEIEELKKQIK